MVGRWGIGRSDTRRVQPPGVCAKPHPEFPSVIGHRLAEYFWLHGAHNASASCAPLSGICLLSHTITGPTSHPPPLWMVPALASESSALPPQARADDVYFDVAGNILCVFHAPDAHNKTMLLPNTQRTLTRMPVLLLRSPVQTRPRPYSNAATPCVPHGILAGRTTPGGSRDLRCSLHVPGMTTPVNPTDRYLPDEHTHARTSICTEWTCPAHLREPNGGRSWRPCASRTSVLRIVRPDAPSSGAPSTRVARWLVPGDAPRRPPPRSPSTRRDLERRTGSLCQCPAGTSADWPQTRIRT